jgi:RND family efflux transporter MFP subunit
MVLEGLAQSWLVRQCRIIQGVSSGVVMFAVPEQDALSAVACWPAGSTASPGLQAAARAALQGRRGIIHQRQSTPAGGSEPVDIVACPLLVRERAIGIVALEVARRPDAGPRNVMQLLKWGSTWLEMLIEQQSAASQGPLVTVLETVALCLEQERFPAAATAVATALATRLACNRVSIGFLQGRRMQVRALSHTARFVGKNNLLRAIGAAMEEAADQDTLLVYPADESAVQITRAHAELATQHGNASICSIPLVDNRRLVGALTLERPAGRPFDRTTIELCRQLAVLIGPALELKRRDDRSLLAKAGETFRRLPVRLLGSGHTGMKLAALVFVAAGCFLAIADGTYRVTADAALEGRIQRAVVAPVDGFIATAGIRAGDTVRQGQVLGELDDRDLLLEQRKWRGEKTQYRREHRNALAEHDRAQAAILGARIEQADARLELVGEQLARMQIVAPFDGVVVSGDLSQSLGAPVERGEVLFTVAPLDDYRLVLQVDERDIAAVAVGQTGSLRLSGIPGDALPMRIDTITPVSEAGEGSNTFRVEARLQDARAHLRPGMQGIGKIDIGERKLLWIWTHRLIDWLRLWIWSWWS